MSVRKPILGSPEEMTRPPYALPLRVRKAAESFVVEDAGWVAQTIARALTAEAESYGTAPGTNLGEL